MKLTRSLHLNKYGYSGYAIEFDAHSQFSWSHGEQVKNLVIFGIDNSSSEYNDNKTKDILVLGVGLTQGLDDTTITAEVKYSINFTRLTRRFVLSLRYYGGNSFFFINPVKMYQLKAKDSEIKPYIFCLGNIPKDFTISSAKKTKLKGYSMFLLFIMILLKLTIFWTFISS